MSAAVFGVAVLHGVSIVLSLKFFFSYAPGCLLCPFHCLTDFVSFLVIAAATFQITRRKFLGGKIDTKGAVLITGCDSGFGQLLAKRLDLKGYKVFAGCLFPSGPGAQKLVSTSSPDLRIIPLDVRKDDEITEAATIVEKELGSNKLLAVVNNAGIHKGLTVEDSSLEDFRDSIDVNTFGPVRVTKTFLPLLKLHKGRVVTVTSLAARLPMPGWTPYTMSKCATSSFCTNLQFEVEEYGIKVISVEPEIFRTALTDQTRIQTNIIDKCLHLSEIKRKEMTELFEDFLKMSTPDLHLVVDSLESAITDKYPYQVYKPRRSFIVASFTDCLEFMPIEILNFIGLLYFKSRTFRRLIQSLFNQ